MTTLQKLNWLSQRRWRLLKKGSGLVIVRNAPYPKPKSINDAIRLEEDMDALWKRNQPIRDV